jgi:hypothetical protein
MQHIPEEDWKFLRTLKDRMLTEACERIFGKIEDILHARTGKEHESYLKLWKVLRHEDKQIAIMFDDLKRSNALMKLSTWRTQDLLSDNDLNGFTEETQRRIEVLRNL